jgi:DNA-binding beta-propeller fold protein YncE
MTFLTKWGSGCFLGNGSGCVDPDGAGPLELGDGQFWNMYSIAIDSSGNVYSIDANNRIQKFDSNGNFLTKWTGGGAFARGLAADASGDIYVTDTNGDQIVVFDSVGNLLTQWGGTGIGDGQFDGPSDVAFSSSGDMYVVEMLNHRVQKFGSAAPTPTPSPACGDFITKWGSQGSGNGEFSFAHAVDVDLSGEVYVTDVNNQRVQVFDSNGTFLRKWGSAGDGLGQFRNPSGIAIDDVSGEVYVTSRAGHRVQVFDSNGTELRRWGGTQGQGDTDFNFPHGIALDSSGEVYVVDLNNFRVVVFDSNGTFLRKWGSFGAGDGEFHNPTDIAINSSGEVYVADQNNHRIQVFDSNGTFLRKWGSQGAGDGEFDRPHGIDIDDVSGNVYVTEQLGHRAQAFDSNGNFIAKWGSQGAGDSQFSYPGGIAVDSAGNLYVGDNSNNRVQKFADGAACVPPPPPYGQCVIDALGALGVTAEYLGDELADLTLACDDNRTITIPAGSVIEDDIMIETPDEYLVIGEGTVIDGKIEGDGGDTIQTVVLGANSSIDSHVRYLENVVVAGTGAVVGGHIKHDISTLTMLPDSEVFIDGQLLVDDLWLQDGSILTVDSKVDVRDFGSVMLDANSSLAVVNGHLNCGTSVSPQDQDPTATLTVGGQNNCSGLVVTALGNSSFNLAMLYPLFALAILGVAIYARPKRS